MKTIKLILTCIVAGMILAELNNIKKAIQNNPPVVIKGSAVRVCEPSNTSITITESEVSL